MSSTASPAKTAPTPETITLTAQGTYPSWIRNGPKQGFQAAISANGLVDTQPVNYIVTTGPTNKNGPQVAGRSCTVAKAPSFVGMGVYSAEIVLEVTISVSASIGTPGSGFCASGVAQASALTGAIPKASGPLVLCALAWGRFLILLVLRSL